MNEHNEKNWTRPCKHGTGKLQTCKGVFTVFVMFLYIICPWNSHAFIDGFVFNKPCKKQHLLLVSPCAITLVTLSSWHLGITWHNNFLNMYCKTGSKIGMSIKASTHQLRSYFGDLGVLWKSRLLFACLSILKSLPVSA